MNELPQITKIFLVIDLVMNVVLFATMGYDKMCAKKDRWRVPERVLFLMAALGGGLGGVLGMLVFHHKTKHASFLIGMPLLLLLNIAVVALSYYLSQA